MLCKELDLLEEIQIENTTLLPKKKNENLYPVTSLTHFGSPNSHSLE
jgi:hypothetical protein